MTGADRKQRWTRAVVAAIAAGVLLGLVILTGCGEQGGGGAAKGADPDPGGYATLRAGTVSVDHPGRWRPLNARQRGTAHAAAVLERDGDRVAKVAVRLRFMTAGDAATAAAGAMASLQPGAKIRWNGQFRIDGREAERIDYTYTARGDRSGDGGSGSSADPAGEESGVPDGTVVRGVDVVTLDAADEPVLVRINTTGGELTDADLDRMVESVTVGK